MPQLIPAGFVVFFKWAFFAVSVLSSINQRHRARQAKSRAEEAARQTGSGHKISTRSTQVPHRIVYGEQLVAGNEVFIETSGADNEYLWLVLNFAEGEIEGLVQSGGVDQIFLDNKLYNEYSGLVSYWFYTGTASQTYNAELYAAHNSKYNGEVSFSDWTDNKRNTAYGVFRVTFDIEKFGGKPDILVQIKGKKLFDLRDDTTTYNKNPVIVAYDWFTNKRYGLGMEASLVETTSWSAAANYCDTKGWEMNMIIDTEQNSYDIFEEIISHFRGALVWSEGQFALKYADLNYESSVKTIGDEHIVRDSSGRATISISQPSASSKPDGIRVKFIDADKDFSFDDIQIGDALGTINDVRFMGTTDKDHASELGVYQLERMRLDRTISGVFRDDCIGLEPFDLVTFSCSARSIEDQLMRVSTVDIQPDGLIGLSMIYESLDLYNQTYDQTMESVYSCTLPDPTTTPPAPGNVVLAEETYTFRERTLTRLKVTFDYPSGYPSGQIRAVEVWVSLDAGVTYTHQFNTTDDFNIEPVEEGATYYIKLISVSVLGVKTEVGQEYVASKTILGLDSVPSSVGSLQAIVNQNAINLYAIRVDNSDISSYEFRLGSSWNGAVFLSALDKPNYSLNGVKPGNHTFWVNTLRNNGLYGDTARSNAVSLIEPPDGWSVIATETDDFTDSEAVFQNTEMIVYSLENYLKCSHGSAGLTGTYTSRIFDRGSSDRFLIYLLAAMTAIGEGTTWEDQFPTTWAAGIEGRTWREVFFLTSAPTISVKMFYGDTSPPSNEVERMEILSAIVTARYFQIEITITDPSETITGLVENYALKFCQF